MPGPIEFTQDLDQEALTNMLDPIQRQEDIDVGRARAYGASMGLEGQAAMGSMIAGAKDTANRNRSSAVSDFNFKLAGMGREDRLRNQQEDWHLQDEAFQASEAEKTRAFQEKLKDMGFSHEEDMATQDRRWGYQDMVIGAMAKGGTELLDAGFSGMGLSNMGGSVLSGIGGALGGL